jgi:hypothetical protein
MEEKIDVENLNFHPVLKDIENIFWFFLLSIRALSDYDVQKILRQKDSIQKGYLCFIQMLDQFNSATDLHIEKTGNVATSKLNILKEMVFIGKAMAILVYEFLLTSDYSVKIKEAEEFKFLKYIRNGAAHNNKFDLKHRYGKKKGQWIISEKETIKWNGMEISRELQGKEVFNNFISIFGVFLLAKHFSEKLEEIDLGKIVTP